MVPLATNEKIETVAINFYLGQDSLYIDEKADELEDVLTSLMASGISMDRIRVVRPKPSYSLCHMGDIVHVVYS